MTDQVSPVKALVARVLGVISKQLSALSSLLWRLQRRLVPPPSAPELPAPEPTDPEWLAAWSTVVAGRALGSAHPGQSDPLAIVRISQLNASLEPGEVPLTLKEGKQECSPSTE